MLKCHVASLLLFVKERKKKKKRERQKFHRTVFSGNTKFLVCPAYFNGIKKFPRCGSLHPLLPRDRYSDRRVKKKDSSRGKKESLAPSIVDQRSGKLIIVHEGASRRLLVTACPASSRRLEGPFVRSRSFSRSFSLPPSLSDEFTLVDSLILSEPR